MRFFRPCAETGSLIATGWCGRTGITAIYDAGLCDDAGRDWFLFLAERLGSEGADGLEELNHALSSYFGRAMDIIQAHGGDLLKMAGDAMMVYWPQDGASADSAQAAISCALEIQRHCHEFEVVPGKVLSMRIGLAQGPLHAFFVGEIQW